MVIISCPSCGAKARVPDDRGLIKVKCPACATRFFYPATFQLSDVQFRCTGDGTKFVVSLRRRNPDDQFQIHLITPRRSSASSSERSDSGVSDQTVHPDSEYDWSGFYCPGCGYMPRDDDSKFVHCGKCKGLVCGASVRVEEGGARYFRCHAECGGGGKITGSIEEYAAEERTETNRPQYTSVDAEKRERLAKPEDAHRPRIEPKS